MNNTNNIGEIKHPDIQQHSMVKSIILHLLPGMLILIFIIIAAPLLEKQNYPLMVTILLAIVFISIPFELGYMLYQGKKESGKSENKNI